MSVPDALRREIKDLLWHYADELGWVALTDADKAKWYGIWTESADVGKRLAPFLDPRKVRVYIKDSLLKPYTRERMSDMAPIARLLGIPEDVMVSREFIKPHGRLLSDGRVIAWSKAEDWKLTLMAVYERAFTARGARPFGVALVEASTKHPDLDSREVVEEAARRLQIERLVWKD